MKATITPQRYLAWVFGALCLILLSVLLWEWEQGNRLERDLLKLRQFPVTPVPPQRILPEFALPNQETGFPELLSRPIFSLNRRPSGVAGKDAGAMKKGQFALVGVLISPQQRSALLRDVVTQKTETVSLIGQLRGLTLGDVQSDRVILRLGAESEELMLNVQTGPKQPVPLKNSVATPAPVLGAAAPASVPAPAAQASSAPVPAQAAASAAQAGATVPASPLRVPFKPASAAAFGTK